jgi:hypothetical protein
MLFTHLIRSFIPAGAVLASITTAAVGSSTGPSGGLFRLLSAELIEDVVVVPTANQIRAY